MLMYVHFFRLSLGVMRCSLVYLHGVGVRGVSGIFGQYTIWHKHHYHALDSKEGF